MGVKLTQMRGGSILFVPAHGLDKSELQLALIRFELDFMGNEFCNSIPLLGSPKTWSEGRRKECGLHFFYFLWRS